MENTTGEELKEINLMRNKLVLQDFTSAELSSRDCNCPKIDLFSDGKYICSTEASKTLKLAKARLLYKHWMDYSLTEVRAQFEGNF